MTKDNNKLTDFGKEMSNPESKKLDKYRQALVVSRQRMEKIIRQGTKRTDFESYACCYDAVCAAIAFLDKSPKG